jgi:hypothetical protein
VYEVFAWPALVLCGLQALKGMNRQQVAWGCGWAPLPESRESKSVGVLHWTGGTCSAVMLAQQPLSDRASLALSKATFTELIGVVADVLWPV